MLAGTAHLTMAVGDGDMLLEIVQPGQLFGQAARFGGGPRLVTAIAGERTTLLHVPDHVLAEIARSEPEVWRSFTELLYSQLAGALQLAAAMIRLPPPQRVAARLAMLAGAGRTDVRVTQAQLAEMTGLSRKTVNAHLRALRTRTLCGWTIARSPCSTAAPHWRRGRARADHTAGACTALPLAR